MVDGWRCRGVMLLGSTSPEFPSQGYKELPIILHWHWRKEGHDPPDPESRPFFSFLLFQCCYLFSAGCKATRGHQQLRNLSSPWHLSIPFLVQIHGACDVWKLNMDLLHFNISALPHAKPFPFYHPGNMHPTLRRWPQGFSFTVTPTSSALSNKWGDWPCSHTDLLTYTISRSMLCLG